MTITATQREERRAWVGSTDVAAILGIDPYRNAGDVYWEKIGETDDITSEAMEVGNWLEGPLIEWAENKLGPIRRNVFAKMDNGLPLASNADGLVDANGEPVECKTSGLKGQWGEEGTDEIPNGVIVQCTVHMICHDAVVCHVPALVGDHGLSRKMYRVERSDTLVGFIEERVRDFWFAHVEPKIPPSDTPHLDVLKRIRRQPDKTVEVDSALVDALQDAKQLFKAAETERDECQALVLAALGDAEGGDLADGRTLTYMQQTRKGYTVEDATFRVLRIRKAKA